MNMVRKTLTGIGAVSVGALFVAGLIGAVGQLNDGPIQTRELQVVDAQGRVRMTLHADGDGPRITMLDATNRPTMILAVQDNGVAAITLGDPKGASRLGLAALPDKVAISLSNKTKGSLISAVGDEHGPNVEITGDRRQVLFQAVPNR